MLRPVRVSTTVFALVCGSFHPASATAAPAAGSWEVRNERFCRMRIAGSPIMSSESACTGWSPRM